MEAKIVITQRMLNKSIIDANKSVVDFAKKYLTTTFCDLENGEKTTVPAVFEDDTATEIRLYRRPRGDKLMSIKDIKKHVSVGDTIIFKHEAGLTYVEVRGKDNVVTLTPRNHFVRVHVEKAA